MKQNPTERSVESAAPTELRRNRNHWVVKGQVTLQTVQEKGLVQSPIIFLKNAE